MRLVVVEGVEGAASLQKTEAAWVHVGKGREMQSLPIGDWPPEPLAFSGQDLQSSRFMGRRTHVVGTPMIERAEKIGRGHSPEPQSVDSRPCDQRHLGVDDGGVRRADRKAKGASNTCGVEQGLNGERIRRRIGLLDPELAEQREFFARIVTGPHCKAACGEAEGLGVRTRAVKGRALEDCHIFEALVRGPENAQTGKTKVAERTRRLQRPEVEISGIVNHLLRRPVLDNVDRDRRCVNEATMQRLEGKAKLLIAPDRAALYAPDRRVLLEREA